RHMTQGERVAPVRNVTLRRDAIVFHLEDGNLFLATPVAGRTIGAVFVGRGAVSFLPPLAIERAEVRRVLGDSVVDARISAAAFVFTDSTLAEFERQLSFGPRPAASPGTDVLGDAIDHLVDGRRVVQPTLITALLNGDTNGFFYAHVKREHGEDLMFVVDPDDDEQVSLLRGGREGLKVQTVAEFRRAEDLRDTTTTDPARGQAFKLVAYGIEATIAKGLAFSAVTTTRLTARRPGASWARFSLFSELDVDSVREERGRAVSIYRTKKSSDLWVRFDPAPRPGDTLALRVAYHGDLIGYTSIVEEITRQWPGWLKVQTATALDQWLFVKSSYSWFPRYGEQAADVDMTFHTPKKYRFASIGRPLDSRLEGDVVTSHWTTVRPTDQVCFSLGELDDFKVAELTQAEAHLVGGAHRGPVRCYYVALQTRIERTADAREPILLWGVERHVHVRSLFPVSREPAVGRLDEQPLIERRGSLHLEPARPLSRDLFHDRRVPDEVAVIGDTQGECVSRAGRRIEPNPQVGALLGAVDAHGPAPFFAHRVHVQLRKQAEPGPARSRASGGEPRRCHGRECEPFGDRRFDPIGDEFERLPPRRVRRGRVPQVLRPPELSDGLNL